jgi:tRNA1(Val) A37 N6-methylase TrmN6
MSKATEIYVLNRAVRLLQPEGGFRTSLDSVMLAAACPAGAGDHVLDMGCGVGGAGFCVLRRVADTRLTGVEIQPACAALAERNIALNDWAAGRVAIARADIRAFAPEGRFDHVICNPPYLEAGAHTGAPDEGKAAALGHADADMDVKTWIDAGFTHLKSRGSLTIIHRADALDRIIQALGRRFGGVTVIPLWPHAGEAAKRVIVRAVKDSRSPAVLHPGIVLHGPDGAYTGAADAVLRGGAALC